MMVSRHMQKKSRFLDKMFFLNSQTSTQNLNIGKVFYESMENVTPKSEIKFLETEKSREKQRVPNYYVITILLYDRKRAFMHRIRYFWDT